MTHTDDLFERKFITAHDLLKRDVTVTIETLAIEELRAHGGRKEKKPVLYFVGKDKGLVLNRTNVDLIAKLHGKETDGWIGQKITLYPTTTKMGTETVDCIRVRPVAPAAPAAAAAAEVSA